MSTTAFAEPVPKKRGLMRSLRSALFGRRDKAKKTKKPLANAHADQLSKLMGSVRPFHVVEMGQSPDRSRTPSSSASSVSSYSSANNLLELLEILEYKGDMPKHETETFYDVVEDEMIDSKADEFIAKFYQQACVPDNSRSSASQRG